MKQLMEFLQQLIHITVVRIEVIYLHLDIGYLEHLVLLGTTMIVFLAPLEERLEHIYDL